MGDFFFFFFLDKKPTFCTVHLSQGQWKASSIQYRNSSFKGLFWIGSLTENYPSKGQALIKPYLEPKLYVMVYCLKYQLIKN